MAGDNRVRQTDTPIERESEDALERGPFAESLVRTLVKDTRDNAGKLISRRATGFVVGLTGRWGLGKSSVLRLVSLKLNSMADVVVVNFNPWLFSGRDELLRAYFSEMRQALGRSGGEHALEMVAALDRYWSAIDWTGRAAAAFVDIKGGGGVASRAWKWISSAGRASLKKPKDRSPAAERIALEKKLAKCGIAVVVLIDELDRVEDEEVRAVAQLIKAVGEIKGVSYLVAYDPRRVADALGRGEDPAERQRIGASYLEKIIQYPVPLRPLLEADIDALLGAALAEHSVTLPEPEGENTGKILAHLRSSIQTPRDVKRLIGSFAILEEAVRGEISAYDVLAYSWILIKSPVLRDQIAHQSEHLVDDPGQVEMSTRIIEGIGQERKPPTVTKVLGDSAVEHEPLLKLLFPRFEARRDEGEGNRLSRRRNLIRLLYLGNPPGMIPRGEIERLWAIQDIDELEMALRVVESDGRVADLIDRLDDFLADLPSSGDTIFWPALARLFVRSHDWINSAETMRNWADDAGTALIRLGLRDSAAIPRVRATLEALVAAGDLVLSPWILRKGMYAYGLSKHSRPGSHGDFALAKDEVIALLEREIPRYREAIMNGTALRRLSNVEAIYVLGNSERWDEELRDAFTAQLDGMEALTTLSALTVPPGFSTERSALNELFDVEVVGARLDRAIEEHGFPEEPWLRASLRQMKAILAGRDPHFDYDED